MGQNIVNDTNVSDIFFRNASAAVVHYLSSSLVIEQVVNGKSMSYQVPVFYNKAQDSQFMRDYFTTYKTDCTPIQYVDGDFDREPFGIVTISSISVNTSGMTNKFVRGEYVKHEEDVNGYSVNKPYSAVIYTLPVDIKFNVEFRTDDSVQSFRIIQSILDNVYRNSVVHFTYKDLRIRCNLTLDNDYTPEKKIDFVYTDDQKERVKTSIMMECYYPVFDESTAMFKGNVIRNFRKYITTTQQSSNETASGVYSLKYDMSKK